MDFAWSAPEAAFRNDIRAFIRDNVPEGYIDAVPGEVPYSDFNMEFCRKLAAKGWMVPHWPISHGGQDSSAWFFSILSEELWMAGEPRGSQYMNVNWIGPAIMAAGDEAQKREHLHRIAAGDVLWCQGFSEPGAGSDLVSMCTTAVRDGDDYVVDGVKIWTSYARRAEFCFLLAKTDLTAPPHKSISIFLVPMDLPGITVEVVPTMLDIHVVHRLTFDGVRVPASARLGPESAGWTTIRDALSNERIGAPRYARAGQVLDRIIAAATRSGGFHDPRLRELATLAWADCEAARILTYRVIQGRADGQTAGPEAYIARAAIVRAERAVSAFATEVVGEDSLVSGSLADGEFRTAMIAGHGGGSYEMQLNLIARLWLNLPKGN